MEKVNYELYSKTLMDIGAQPISKKRILIGSGQACDIVLPFKDVSPIHAIVEVLGRDGFKLYDMNSSAGSGINGKKVVAGEFKRGDSVSFGSYEFEVRLYEPSDVLPPPLKILEPGAKIPQAPRAPQPPPPAQTPKAKAPEAPKAPPEAPDFAAGEKPKGGRGAVYPLAMDPNAEFSEYIFEDADNLYPVFHYRHGHMSVEVITVFNEQIQSVDYVPEDDGTYYFVGKDPSLKDIEFPYFGPNDKIPLVEMSNRRVSVHPIPGHEVQVLGEEKTKSGSLINLGKEDILHFSNKDIQVFIRETEAPPKVDPAPIIAKDKDFRKYLVLTLLSVVAFLGLANLYTVDKEKKKEKVPERIATILYKRKIKKTIPRSVDATPKEKKRLQKSPKQKQSNLQSAKKAPTPKKTAATNTKKNSPGKRTAPKKTAKLKKAPPKKAPVKSAVTQVKKSATRKGRSKPAPSKNRRRIAPKPTAGRVETYKSDLFKNTVSRILQRGGQTSGVVKTRRRDSQIGNSALAGTNISATAKEARVSNKVGDISGVASGTIDTKRGTGDLVDKTKIYTAGLPYKTVILGGIDPDIIRKILVDNIPRFRRCYQEVLDQSSKSFSGIVRLNFVIGASGRVSRAGVDGRSKLPGGVKGCVVRVLKSIAFPQPSGGGVVEVNQPMNFYPKTW